MWVLPLGEILTGRHDQNLQGHALHNGTQNSCLGIPFQHALLLHQFQPRAGRWILLIIGSVVQHPQQPRHQKFEARTRYTVAPVEAQLATLCQLRYARVREFRGSK